MHDLGVLIVMTLVNSSLEGGFLSGTISTGLIMAEQDSKNGYHQCFSPQGVSQLCLASQAGAPRLVSESLSLMVYTLFDLVFCAGFQVESVCVQDSKNRFSFTYNFVLLFNVLPVVFQSQMFWGLPLLCRI